MDITFDLWSADEIIQAYLDFIKKKNSKETFVDYSSEKYGLKVMVKGKLDIDDLELKKLLERIQYFDTRHKLTLDQKNWKIKFKFKLYKDSVEDRDEIKLSFDDSLHKEVYSHFKKFKPIKIK